VSNETSEPGEGNSPAAWTAVIIMLAAVTIGTIAFYFDLPIVVWVSVGLLIVGFIVGVVLARLGYGINGARFSPKEH
jgi:high-affinity Fe2+/Pb2+ permease